MNDNPFEIKEEACASSPDHRRYLLIQAVDTETGEIVWAVGDDQICAVTRADFIRTPEIRYNDVLIQEFPYKENTPESVGRWRPLIEELVKLTLAKYRTLDGLARAYPQWVPEETVLPFPRQALESAEHMWGGVLKCSFMSNAMNSLPSPPRPQRRRRKPQPQRQSWAFM